MFWEKLYIRLVALVDMLTLGKRLKYREAFWRSPKVPPSLDGYKIAFITDTHDISIDALNRIVARINARKADLLLLGGDFSTDDPETTLAILGQTVTRHGILGVEGNHDEHTRLFAAMSANHIKPLNNDGLNVCKGLYVAGVEDLWNRRPDVQQAVKNAAPADVVLLLCHNPDVAMQQDTSRVDVMLCGHNHGGQITLFGLWAPALWPFKTITRYGHKFKAGWVKALHNTPVFVSRGAGSSKYKPRICARPDVVFLTLQHAEEPECR